MPLDFTIAADVVASAAPFLPRGKGALILILGGLAMLVVTLLLSRVASSLPVVFTRAAGPLAQGVSRTARGGQGKAEAAKASATASRWVPVAGTDWVAGLLAELRAKRLGSGHFLRADAERCVLELSGCQSCVRGAVPLQGCERERTRIEQFVRRKAPAARVQELTCRGLRAQPCTFEIRRRGNANA